MTTSANTKWPALKSYKGDYLRRIALPLGGIGTGCVSLGGRGNLTDWEIMNSPAKGYNPAITGLKNLGTFFAISTLSEGKRNTLCLEGPIDSSEFEAAEGCKTPNSGFPRFKEAVFNAAYPTGSIELIDDTIPLDVELRAMNPMIPGDSASSSLPCAMLTFNLSNPTSADVEASICGTFLNPIGCDGRNKKPAWGGRIDYLGYGDNYNIEKECDNGTRIQMLSKSEETSAESFGEMCVTAFGGESAGLRTAWKHLSWSNTILDFWDEFSENGEITQRESDKFTKLFSSLARKTVIKAGESKEIHFLLCWRFPNRKAWSSDVVGNYYSERFKTSVEAADYIIDNWDELRNKTLDYVQTFCDSPLPDSIKEAALFNSSTLRTQTCFQTPDGNFFGWEGVHDFQGSCEGSCTHVWNYEQTTAFMFSDLSQSLRNVEFLHSTNDEGAMRFRTKLPLALNQDEDKRRHTAADGQMGCIMKIYRDWKLSGDDQFLMKLWPQVKKALSFSWCEGGWDADKDGVMEGCQHNTMDVNYYGPNPQMQVWYLGALKAASLMAKYLTDKNIFDEMDFHKECEKLFENGKEFCDNELFNGEYYSQIIKMPNKIHPHTANGAKIEEIDEPILQLGNGCLIDQLVGQYMAHVCGLGHILNPDNVKTTLKSILKYNLKKDFYHHFNHLRNYVFADETAVLMATYPKGDRLEEPFPYYNEVMTGFEHTLAAHLIYEGLQKEGLELVQHIRNRYDGKKRSPYNEAECGHHYARAMAAWAEVLAYNQFHYDGVTKTMYLSEQNEKMFFSTGSHWGTWHTEKKQDGLKAIIKIHQGNLNLDNVYIDNKSVEFEIL
jgi:non-lysosomal glucosylceramidase